MIKTDGLAVRVYDTEPGEEPQDIYAEVADFMGEIVLTAFDDGKMITVILNPDQAATLALGLQRLAREELKCKDMLVEVLEKVAREARLRK